MNSEQPKYTHDCPNCVFLGGFICADVYYDLYACISKGVIDTVVGRYSDDGPEYISGVDAAKAYEDGIFDKESSTSIVLLEGLKRAEQLIGKKCQ